MEELGGAAWWYMRSQRWEVASSCLRRRRRRSIPLIINHSPASSLVCAPLQGRSISKSLKSPTSLCLTLFTCQPFAQNRRLSTWQTRTQTDRQAGRQAPTHVLFHVKSFTQAFSRYAKLSDFLWYNQTPTKPVSQSCRGEERSKKRRRRGKQCILSVGGGESVDCLRPI